MRVVASPPPFAAPAGISEQVSDTGVRECGMGLCETDSACVRGQSQHRHVSVCFPTLAQLTPRFSRTRPVPLSTQQSVHHPPMAGVVLQVDNMTCGKCVGRVESALRKVHGVAAAKVDLAAGRAEVAGSATVGMLLAALEERGYPAQQLVGASLHGHRCTVLVVDNMTCGKCVGRVERALKAVPGVAGVSVDLAVGTACVHGGAGCPTAFAEKMTAALAAAGYPAKAVQGDDANAAEAPESLKAGNVEMVLMAQEARAGDDGAGLPAQGAAKARCDASSGTSEAGVPSCGFVELEVDNMTCGKCVGRVERALKVVQGVTAASVDLATGRAKVEGAACPAALVAVLEEGGYPARVAGAVGCVELAVGNMTCHKCVGRVERALKTVPGVCAVSVDLEAGLGRARVQGTGDVKAMVAVLEEAGYPAREQAAGQHVGETATRQVKAAGGSNTEDWRGAHGDGAAAPDLLRSGTATPIDLAVEGMTCGKCVGRVERALKSVAGVSFVGVDLPGARARVEGSADVDAMMAALEAAGYPARAVGAASNCQADARIGAGGRGPGSGAHILGDDAGPGWEGSLQEVARAAGAGGRVDELKGGVRSGQAAGVEEEYTLKVEGITCGACVGRIERGLGKVPGVVRVNVSLANNTAVVGVDRSAAGSCSIGVRTLIEALDALGYPGALEDDETRENPQDTRRRERLKWQRLLAHSAALTAPAFLLAGPLDHISSIHSLLHASVWRAVTVQILLVFALCAPVQFVIGGQFYQAAAKAIRHGSGSAK